MKFDEIKSKIDILLDSGYRFEFLNSGQAVCGASPNWIKIPYGISDEDFIEIIDDFYDDSLTLVAQSRTYIINKSHI